MRFARHWESYLAEVVPDGAGRVQVRETKLAFYAGAVALFRDLERIGDQPANPTQNAEDAQELGALYEEIVAEVKRTADDL